jgi:sugar O-acyltransferase (sialic acid O-acetyltransferase NeuD family)|tara:strand:+ start:64 stop:726 length:663 start_codon:yes stop_codon:yes gene_type:complete
MKNVVLIGGGDQAHYTIDIIHKEGKYNIIGIIDAKEEIGKEKFGYKIIGRQESIEELSVLYKIDGGIISIGDNWTRYYVAKEIKNYIPNFKFFNAIHPSCIIGENVKFGEGIVAMAGCIFNPRAIIGDQTFFATGAQVEHDNIIGDYASISAGSITGGYVELGKFAAITLGVTVFDRTVIGENTVVGAGSLVVKDLPPNVLAYGNPAKIIRPRKDGEKFL